MVDHLLFQNLFSFFVVTALHTYSTIAFPLLMLVFLTVDICRSIRRSYDMNIFIRCRYCVYIPIM